MTDVSRREQLITLAVALGLTAVFAAVLLLPGARRLRQIRDQNAALLQEQQRCAEEFGLLAPRLAEDIARLQADVTEALRRVPPEDIRVDFEQDLRDLGERYGLVGEDYFKTTSYEREGSITVRGALLRFQTTFMNLFEFLKELEAQERLIVVQGLDMQPLRRPDGLFDVTVELNFFYGEL